MCSIHRTVPAVAADSIRGFQNPVLALAVCLLAACSGGDKTADSTLTPSATPVLPTSAQVTQTLLPAPTPVITASPAPTVTTALPTTATPSPSPQTLQPPTPPS